MGQPRWENSQILAVIKSRCPHVDGSTWASHPAHQHNGNKVAAFRSSLQINSVTYDSSHDVVHSNELVYWGPEPEHNMLASILVCRAQSVKDGNSASLLPKIDHVQLCAAQVVVLGLHFAIKFCNHSCTFPRKFNSCIY